MERILVIKLGALGDVVQAEPAFRAIRDAHKGAALACLTTPAYKALIERMGHFERVWEDGRPEGDAAWRALVKRVRGAKFSRVYDLQCNDRTSAIFVALWPFPPEWSGVAPFCSHRHKGREAFGHALERMADQLRIAGVAAPKDGGAPILPWAARDPAGARLGRYGLLIPACSPRRPEKIWPVERFAELARALLDEGLKPVIVGAQDARPAAETILRAAPGAIDRTGATSLVELAGLAAHARFFVGPDTGPCHLAAAAGAPGVVVFGPASDPARHAPRGEGGVISLIGHPIEKVTAADVMQSLRALGAVRAIRKAS